MAELTPLFKQDFLSNYLTDFELSNVIGISKGREIIETWAGTEETGKLDLMKEESVKSRYLMEIFGQLLGFSYKNKGRWLFQEEVKSKTGQTKPDGAMGTFYISENKLHSEVRIVIEAKDSRTPLDEKQKRANSMSPVDQAFLYSTKMNGKCKWVIVTNLREIRFYHANDQSSYQRYFLSELREEAKLKELVFLFHRDRLDNHIGSTTDKLFLLQQKDVPAGKTKGHIIDQLYASLKRFDGINFISPKFIANLKPFNVLDNYVWHYISPGKLFTLNPHICELIGSLSYQEMDLKIHQDYEPSLVKAKVIEYRKKLNYILEKLFKSHIRTISAVKDLESVKNEKKSTLGFSYRHPIHVNNENGSSLKIKIGDGKVCDCVACNYRSLDFRKMISKTERMEAESNVSTLELAYAHYLLSTDDHKRSYRLLKEIAVESKGSDEKILQYFTANFNLLYHYNLFDDEGEGKKIRQELYAIDLERLINNEIDIYIDDEVRKFLLEVKDNKLFNDAVNKCRKIVQQIRELKLTHESGGKISGPDYASQLHDEYLKIHGHFQQNYLVHDVFTSHHEFVELVFEGMLLSIQTTDAGLSGINEFYLTEIVLYSNQERLKLLLSQTGKIPIEPDQKKEFLVKAEAFFSSYTHVGLFGHVSKDNAITRQLLNYRFHDKFNNVFNNLCALLAHLQLTKQEFAPLTTAILKMIDADDDLRWWDIEQIGKLIISDDLFSEKQLFELLKSAIGPHRYPKGNKYKSLIKMACDAFEKFHPAYKLDDRYLIQAAILNCHNEGKIDLFPLAAIWKISSTDNQKLLTIEFERELDSNFNDHLYEHLLKHKIIAHDRKDYLMKLALQVNKFKVIGFIGIKDGIPKFQHTAHINFLVIPYILGLDFGLPEFMVLETLSPFDQWLRKPLDFDYADFDPYWLLACSSHVLERLSGNQKISSAIGETLHERFNDKLAKIYFRHFSSSHTC
jgi:hypothetical protein